MPIGRGVSYEVWMSFNLPSPSLGEIFRNHYPFFVPRYQRGYAWESDEISDFIEDIKEINGQLPHAGAHFMGGIVHVNLTAANSVSRRFEVVDGQQRMATVSLAVAAIIHGIQELHASSSDQAFQNECDIDIEDYSAVFLKYSERRVSAPKLVVSRADNPFFRGLLDGSSPVPSRDSHHRLQYAYDVIKEELVDAVLQNAGMSELQKRDSLRQVYDIFLNKCIVIHIVSQSHQEAYRLFTVLNDRGRSLTDGDLLRAKTLELLEADPAAQLRVENLWDGILDGAPEEIDKFLKAYYPSVTGRRAAAKDLLDSYMNQFIEGKSIQELEGFVNNLSISKPRFDMIRMGKWPFRALDDWHTDRLDRLVTTLRHEAAHPLLLSAYALGEAEFTKVVSMLERFVFRYITIVSAHAGPLIQPYYSEAKAIHDNPASYSVSTLKSKLSALLNSRAGDTLFESNLVAKLEYSDNNAKNREIRHFFTTLESYCSWYRRGATGSPCPEVMTIYKVKDTTLEHVYPQTPDPTKWIDSTLADSTNSLGNLAVMSSGDNSAAGNDDFTTKKIEYRASSLAMTRALNDFTTWSLPENHARTGELVAMAKAVFRM